jgi:hypothetical protein
MDKYSDIRNERLEKQGAQKLSVGIKKKIETTMIGSLSSFEKYFGDLLESDSNFRSLYQQARSEILDKGNHQLRNIDSELDKYTIKERIRHYYFKVQNKEDLQ